MHVKPAAPTEPDPPTRQFYINVMTRLDEAKLPYVVGGGYAMAYYTGIARNTKDLEEIAVHCVIRHVAFEKDNSMTPSGERTTKSPPDCRMAIAP